MANPWDNVALQVNRMPTQEQILLAQNQMPLPHEELLMPPPQMTPMPPAPKARPAYSSGAMEPIRRSDYDDLVKRLNEKGIQSLAMQAEGIKRLEGQQGAIDAIPRQVDLTPISNLLDQWTGQDLTSNYKRPLSPEERNALMLQLENQVQRAREGMSGNEIELLKSQLGIESAREMAQERAEDRKLSREALNVNKSALANDRHDKEVQRQREAFAKSDDISIMKGTTRFTQALNKYEALVNKYGVAPTGEGAAKLGNAYSDMQVAFKEIEDLGALAGPDLQILFDQVGPAGGIANYFKAAARGGKEGVLAQVQGAKEKARNKFSESAAYVKNTFPDIADQQITPYQKAFDATQIEVADTKKDQAIAWAKKNKSDPRAKQILKLHGVE